MSKSTPNLTTVQEITSKGGKAAAKKMTKEQRIARARAGGLAQGRKGLPRASHEGELKIGNIVIPCAVVNGRRVLTQTGMQAAFGKAKPHGGRKAKEVVEFELGEGRLPAFLAFKSLISLITKDLTKKAEPIKFVHPKSNQIAYGYDATLLPDVCSLYLDARDAGLLPVNQMPMAAVADTLIRAFAAVGIISLVDESTGYQDVRDRDELTKILEAYISPELQPWTKRFHPEFFKQIYRIHGWKWGSFGKNHPSCVGNFINKYVYKALPEGVLDELQTKNPVTEIGHREYLHHQFLQPIGNETLDKHLAAMTAVMRLANSKSEFASMAERAWPGNQLLLEI